MFCRFCGHEGKESYHRDCSARVHGWVKHSKRYCECCGDELQEHSPGKPSNGKLCGTCIPGGLNEGDLITRVRRIVLINPDKLNIVYECACEGKEKINHHFDYYKPLDVLKLCRSCHGIEHARLRRLAAAAAQDNSPKTSGNSLGQNGPGSAGSGAVQTMIPMGSPVKQLPETNRTAHGRGE